MMSHKPYIQRKETVISWSPSHDFTGFVIIVKYSTENEYSAWTITIEQKYKGHALRTSLFSAFYPSRINLTILARDHFDEGITTSVNLHVTYDIEINASSKRDQRLILLSLDSYVEHSTIRYTYTYAMHGDSSFEIHGNSTVATVIVDRASMP